MDADYSFHVKIIETHARAFFKVIIFSIDSVIWYFGQNLMIVNNFAMTKTFLITKLNV